MEKHSRLVYSLYYSIPDISYNLEPLFISASSHGNSGFSTVWYKRTFCCVLFSGQVVTTVDCFYHSLQICTPTRRALDLAIVLSCDGGDSTM